MWDLTFENRADDQIGAIFRNFNDKKLEFNLVSNSHDAPEKKFIEGVSGFKDVNGDLTFVLEFDPDFYQLIGEANFKNLYPSGVWLKNHAGAETTYDILTGHYWHTDPSKMVLKLDNSENSSHSILSEEDVPFLKEANKTFLQFFKDVLYNIKLRETIQRDFEECLKILIDYFKRDPNEIPRWLR